MPATTSLAVCSECIRTNLSFQERSGSTQCPQCRAACDTRDLRPNTALRTLVSLFASTRSQLIAACTHTRVASPPGVSEQNHTETAPRRPVTRRASGAVVPTLSTAQTTALDDAASQSTADSEYAPPSNAGQPGNRYKLPADGLPAAVVYVAHQTNSKAKNSSNQLTGPKFLEATHTVQVEQTPQPPTPPPHALLAT